MNLRRFALIGPRTIAGQVVLLVLVSVGLFHLALSAISTLSREQPSRPELSPFAVADRFAEFVRVLDRLPASARPEVIAVLRETYPVLEVALVPEPSPLVDSSADPPAGAEALFAHLGRVLGPGLTVHAVGPAQTANTGRHVRELAVALRDGALVTGLVLPIGRPPNRINPVAIVAATLGFVALMLTLLLWWATRGLTAPLTRFAHAAAGFSLDSDPAPLPEGGPFEVRTAARALNRMRTRIRRMVEDRTRMLAAVGHDLRTPITRLRLRAEFIEDEAMRTQFLRDLDQMAAMIHSALSYLREGHRTEKPPVIDLATLLQTVRNEFSNTNHDVTYEGPDHLLARAWPDELHRAMTNLVENAVKFGTCAAIRLGLGSGSTVAIEVADDGPGIPDADKEAMLEPFARGDAARNMNGSAGFGLGLSIVRRIAEGHGGELSLHDREPSGLIARISLPNAAQEPGAKDVGRNPANSSGACRASRPLASAGGANLRANHP